MKKTAKTEAIILNETIIFCGEVLSLCSLDCHCTYCDAARANALKKEMESKRKRSAKGKKAKATKTEERWDYSLEC